MVQSAIVQPAPPCKILYSVEPSSIRCTISTAHHRMPCAIVNGSPTIFYFDNHFCNFILINIQSFKSISIVYDVCIMNIIVSFSIFPLLFGLLTHRDQCLIMYFFFFFLDRLKVLQLNIAIASSALILAEVGHVSQGEKYSFWSCWLGGKVSFSLDHAS